MTIHLRYLGIGILIAAALTLLLVGEVHAAQVMMHAHAVSAAPALALQCPSTTTHC